MAYMEQLQSVLKSLLAAGETGRTSLNGMLGPLEWCNQRHDGGRLGARRGALHWAYHRRQGATDHAGNQRGAVHGGPGGG